MNDSLYNPDSMSKEDIKALFVARQPLLDELVATIRNQPKGAGVQHLLIIAPRGMGKTTMLLMVQFAVEDNADLSKSWRAVRFPEESYDVTELADLWLKLLRYLDDESLKSKIEEIESRFPKSEDLREAAWALIKDWSKANKKRIVLLADNFDMILAQIGNQIEQARLRDILMNDGTIMLIGCAPTYFYEIQNYEQPLYNFFKIHNLNDLKFPDIEELIRRRAEIDDIPNIEELLRKNRTRIKALETFTGGVPRLVLMLYRIIISSDMTEVRVGLEKLLDAVTPFYKDKTEKLPPQQRKIINEIAQYSLEKNEGISPTEIAKRIRLTANQVSSQLKRLAENGYVKALNIRGRSNFYVLSEPLYAIWAQMRFGRNAREKRNWLVQILKAIYDVQEIQKEIEKLSRRVEKFKIDGREKKVKGTLEYMMCLLEASPDLFHKNFLLAIESYLELKEVSSIKAELKMERLPDLSIKVLEELFSEKIINKDNLDSAKSYKYIDEALVLFKRLSDYQNEDDKNLETHTEIIKLLENVININHKGIAKKIYIPLSVIYKGQASNLLKKKKYAEAQTLLDNAVNMFNKTKKGNDFKENVGILADAHSMKSSIFVETDQPKEILLECNRAIEIYESLFESVRTEDINFKSALRTYCFKILLSADTEEIEKSLSRIMELYSLDENKSVEIMTMALSLIYTPKTSHKIKKAIIEHKLERDFQHIILSIDYLERKDENLIEKLSPEIRLTVEETIITLQRIEKEAKEFEIKQLKEDKKGKASEKLKSPTLPK